VTGLDIKCIELHNESIVTCLPITGYCSLSDFKVIIIEPTIASNSIIEVNTIHIE